jgi:hypothetical protein
MPPSPPPIALFAFANDRVDKRRYLRNLPLEARELRNVTHAAWVAGTLQPEFRSNASLLDVQEVFLEPSFRGRIVIFHFGGHADGKTILLETSAGAPSEIHAQGLAALFGTLRESLKLVFLNGCSTEPQVNELLKARVPAVIATSCEIDDGVAMDFARLFYKSLASGAGLIEAFEQAQKWGKAKLGKPRKAYRFTLSRLKDRVRRACRSRFRGRPDEGETWPWSLHLSDPDPQIKGWTPFRDRSSSTAVLDEGEKSNLLYLCDREPQETDLQLAVEDHRRRYPRRPLVVQIQGEYDQVFDRFVDRLVDPTLPRILGNSPVQRKGPMAFRYARRASLSNRLDLLRRDLADRLASRPEFKQMAAAVAATRGPVLIDVDVPLEGDERILESGPIVEWLRDLARWDDLPEGKDLLFLLRFGYTKKASEDGVEDLLSQVVAQAPQGLNVVKLKRLGNVYQRDVRLWIEQDVSRALATTGRASDICDCLNVRASEMFLDAPTFPTETVPSLPMLEVARRLRGHLDQCLQGGGR